MISEKGRWQLLELLNQDCQDLGKWREGGGSGVRARVAKNGGKGGVERREEVALF